MSEGAEMQLGQLRLMPCFWQHHQLSISWTRVSKQNIRAQQKEGRCWGNFMFSLLTIKPPSGDKKITPHMWDFLQDKKEHFVSFCNFSVYLHRNPDPGSTKTYQKLDGGPSQHLKVSC